MVCLLATLSSSLSLAQGNSEKELIQLSKDWMTAAQNRDEKTLNKLVAPEFKLSGTDISKNMPIISRDMWMKNTLENLKIDSVNYIQIKVNEIGNVAIVQSIFYWSVSFMKMPAKKDTVHLIDTWIKRDNNWQVVSRLLVD